MEADLKKCDAEIAELQVTLENEEKQLESIIESLKGKTDVFQVELEQKQQELAPWTERINEQVSNIKVFQSEKDLLLQRMNANENSLKQIKVDIKKFTEVLEEKVRSM